MQRFVELLVPHGFWDGLGRMTLVMVVVTAWAFFSHYSVFDAQYPTKLHYLAHVLFVALPPVVFIFRMLTYLNYLHVRMEELASTDALTGLANRRAFFERASAESRRRGGVAMVVDVDHFKSVNDTYGHEVGDRCLVALAEHFRAETRATDVIGRLGGEEFAIYLVDAHVNKAREIGERFAEGIQLPVGDGRDDVRVTASVGAAAGAAGTDLEVLLSRADEMMYRAKRAGRARLLVWGRHSARVPSDARRSARAAPS